MYFPLPQSVMTYSYGVRHKQMPPSSGGYLSQGSILAVVIFFLVHCSLQPDINIGF